MEITKEYIDNYLDELIEQRKAVLSLIEKNPIIGVDISKLDKRQKLFLGGLQKLKIDVESEIIGVYKFLLPFEEYKDDKILKEIVDGKVKLFDIEGSIVKFTKDIDSALNNI